MKSLATRLLSSTCAGALLLLPAPGIAQSNQPLFATGTLTPGHALVLQQTGTPGSAVTRDAGPAIAGNFTELGITNDGLPLCVRDKAQQHLLCFGANALGGGLISFNPIGSGSPTGLNLNLNGQTFPLPGSGGGGNVVGPTSPVPGVNNLVQWNGGLSVKDSNLLAFSGDASGVGDNFTALAGAFSLTVPTQLIMPAGVFRISCGHQFIAAGALSIQGAGPGKTIIRQDPGCTPVGNFMQWTNFSGVRIDGVTIDVNSPAVSAVQNSVLQFIADGNNQLVGPRVTNSEILNFSPSSGGAYGVSVNVFNAAASWTNPVIYGDRIAMSAPAATANECIAFGGRGAFDSTAPGNIHSGMVVNNVCVNSGIQQDGDHGYWGGNEVYGWSFGNGIYSQAVIPAIVPNPNHDNLFVANNLHSSLTGYDVNNSAASCVENDGQNSIWIGNNLHDCGGEGFRNYGTNTVIQGGAIYNNGKTTSIVGNYQPAGINAVISGAGAPYNSANLTVDGVAIYDTAGTQLYAYADASTIAGPVNIKGKISGAAGHNAIHQTSPQGTLEGDVWQLQSYTQATLTCIGGGAPTNASADVYTQKQPFKVVYAVNAFVVTNGGSCVGGLIVPLTYPADPTAHSFDYSGAGASGTTGKTMNGFIVHTDPSHIQIKQYDNGWPATDNTAYTVSGDYPTPQD